MKGGSCSSNHVNKATAETQQKDMDDVFNLTAAPGMIGGMKKASSKKLYKSAKRKGSKKRKTKKSKRKTKRRRSSRRKTMKGGGVANLMGCGPVNNESTFKNPGCNKETIMNPPNLGNAGSGLNPVDGLAGYPF